MFKNIAALLHNIDCFSNHSSAQQYSDFYIKTNKEKLFVQDEASEYWVLMKYIEGRKASPEDSSDLHLLGTAVGSFLKIGTLLPIKEFKETLPLFHDIEFRIEQLDTSLLDCNPSRKQQAKELLELVNSERVHLIAFKQFLDDKCQKIVCHNDTKSDNIIILEEDALLLDLDTIMPGYIAYDFGDALRSLFGTGKEDALEIKKASEIKNIYTHFRQGFIKVCENNIKDPDLASLDYASVYMCYIMGIRFLTDYLNGDVYYKTVYKDQNLRRAKGQLKLGARVKGILVL